TISQADLTFYINLSNIINAMIADGQGAGVIKNDDGALSINDVTHLEGNAGGTNYVFAVTLANASTKQITVQYATADGSASVGDGDYQATNGVLTFNPGDIAKNFTVVVNGDLKYET